MKKHYFLRNPSWCAPLLLAVCTASLAQTSDAQNTSATQAADPQAKVPTVAYRSVFKETSLGVEKDTRDWRKANDEVGKFTRGHVDILKWEEQESAKTMKEPMALPGSQQKPAAAPEGAAPAKPVTTKPIAAPAHKH